MAEPVYKIRDIKGYLALRDRVKKGEKWIAENGGYGNEKIAREVDHCIAMAGAMLSFELEHDLLFHLDFNSTDLKEKTPQEQEYLINKMLEEYENKKNQTSVGKGTTEENKKS